MRNVSRHVALRGHTIKHEPSGFPGEFKEVALGVLEYTKKIQTHRVIRHELLVITFQTRARVNDKPLTEVIRIPVEYFVTFSQAIALSIYGRRSTLEFAVTNHVVVREEPGESTPCMRLTVSCDQALMLELENDQNKVKTVMFESGANASRALLVALSELTFWDRKSD